MYINFVELESSVLHAKFQEHRTSGSREDFERFLPYEAWWPSWSCNHDHFYKFMFRLSMEAPRKIGFDWPCGFRNKGV